MGVLNYSPNHFRTRFVKIKALNIITPVTKQSFVNPTKGPAYQAWQQRWESHRPSNWEWSTSPQAMGREAIAALAEDFTAHYGKDAPATVIRLMAAMTVDLPTSQRQFQCDLPVDGEHPSVLHLSWGLNPPQLQMPDEAAVSMEMMAENDTDRKQLEDMGLLNSTETIPAADALAFLDAASETVSDVRDKASLESLDGDAMQQALERAQIIWPEWPSPYQAFPLVLGWLIWQRAVDNHSTNTSLALRSITYDHAPDMGASDCVIQLIQTKVAPEASPRRAGPRR